MGETKPKNSKKNLETFTLIEVMVAIYLLIVSLLSGVFLLVKIQASTSVIANKFIAANLAQEGIELVRNIRDTNLIEGKNWDKDLNEGFYKVDYMNSALIEVKNSASLDDCFENENELVLLYSTSSKNSGYQYKEGRKSIFKRIIRLSDKEQNYLKVTVRICWNERGVNFWNDASEYIFNY